MQYVVRFHALNPTMKAREDLPIERLSDFWEVAMTHIHAPGELVEITSSELSVSGVSLVKLCHDCGHSEVVAKIHTDQIQAFGR